MPKNGTTSAEMIIRTVKDRQHPYVMIQRRLFEDSRLSLEARGLMGYLLAKPDDWQVRVPDLQRTAGVGRDQMRRILRELEAAGYLERRRTHGADGRWTWESWVHETPLTPPSPENPSVVTPATDNPTTDGAAMDEPPMGERPTANPAIYQVVTVPIKESLNNQRDDSNRLAPALGGRLTTGTPAEEGDRPRYSPFITQLILDFSAEFSDPLHGPSNVTRALRLWQRSGLTDELFVAACQEAKRTLRQAQARGIANKMAYFFTVLERAVLPPGPAESPAAGE